MPWQFAGPFLVKMSKWMRLVWIAAIPLKLSCPMVSLGAGNLQALSGTRTSRLWNGAKTGLIHEAT